MSYNKEDLGEGYTLYEIDTKTPDDIIEILHNDEIPIFIKRQVAKNTLKAKGRILAYLEVESNEIIDLMHEFFANDAMLISEMPTRNLNKLERKLRKLREELQKMTKGLKKNEQSSFDGPSD